MKAPEQLLAQIREDEGLRLKSYQDSLGILTIGYGHVPAFEGQSITEADAESFLQSDLKEAEIDMLAHFPWITVLSEARYCVLWNMAFNIGADGLAKFVHMLAAVKEGNWAAAVLQMQDSLWASQVGNRAKQLESQMETGQWVI